MCEGRASGRFQGAQAVLVSILPGEVGERGDVKGQIETRSLRPHRQAKELNSLPECT